jgi:hypothetical protein
MLVVLTLITIIVISYLIIKKNDMNFSIGNIVYIFSAVVLMWIIYFSIKFGIE